MLRRVLPLLFVFSVPVVASAQTAPRGNTSFSGGKITYRAGGVRLDSTPGKPARIQTPELEVVAEAIAFDSRGGKITQVRAIGGVDIKLNLAPSGGGERARVEAKSQTATLTTASRELVLKGNLSGFYQVGGGARNTLAGDEATLSYAGSSLIANVAGGADGVVLTLPAESAGQPGALGALRVTGKNIKYDEGAGRAFLTGGARVVSSGGEYAFDVSAPTMTIVRKNDGSLERLATSGGRAQIKLDLPPDPAAGNVNSAGSRPTRVEVASDTAIIERGNLTGTFAGNVKGFYRLQTAQGAQNFDFAGDKAVIAYDPSASGNETGGLNVEVTGNVEVETPAFNLDF